jgi:hypothetical protein
VSDEIREDSRHLLEESSEEETGAFLPPNSDYGSLLFGRLMINSPMTTSHPQPVKIFRLWQTFIDNVNPLTKLLHVPTIQQLILEASGNLDEVSSSVEALMFSIYHSAVVSMDDQGCQTILGESRPEAMAKYSMATQQALINAKVLRTSNIVVLQALTLYLVSSI